jgi:hypothetical protein
MSEKTLKAIAKREDAKRPAPKPRKTTIKAKAEPKAE